MATAFTEYVHAYFRGPSPRYTVVGQMVTSKQGFLGSCASGFQQGQRSGGFPDLLYHGTASRPILRAIGAIRGI